MGKQTNVLLIQPHSDDVLFSASKFLLNRGDYGSVVLLTVENSPLRNKEDEELANLFDLKDIHLEGLVNDESYYHFYKEDKKRVFSFRKSYESIKEYLGNDKLKEIRKNLNKKVDYYKEKGYTIVCCLGVGHPTHYFVRKCIEDRVDLFYRDFPHSYKRKTQNCVEMEISDFKISETYKLSKEEHELKWQIAYQVYKTQRSLLFFEKGYIDKNLPEEYYVKK